jgi:hypothetical protein
MQKLIGLVFIFYCLAISACSEKKASQENDIPGKPIPAEGLNKTDPIPVPVKTAEVPFDTSTPPAFNRPGISGDFDSFGNNFYNSTIITSQGKLHELPETTSKVLQKLAFLTKFRILGIITPSEDHTPNNFWFKIKLQDGSVGYVLGKEVATHAFDTEDKKFAYWVLQNKSERNPKPKYKVIKFDLLRKKPVDSIAFEKGFQGAIPGLEGSFVIEEVKNTAFPGKPLLLRFAENMDFCGGGTTVQFLTDSHGKFTLLPATSFFNDDSGGSYDNADIYLPVQVNGKTILAGNGDPGNALNLTPYDLNIFPEPQDVSIPTEELLVELTTSGDGISEKTGKPINEKISATYYHWYGANLKKIRTAPFKL